MRVDMSASAPNQIIDFETEMFVKSGAERHR